MRKQNPMFMVKKIPNYSVLSWISGRLMRKTNVYVTLHEMLPAPILGPQNCVDPSFYRQDPHFPKAVQRDWILVCFFSELHLKQRSLGTEWYPVNNTITTALRYLIYTSILCDIYNLHIYKAILLSEKSEEMKYLKKFVLYIRW